MNTTLDTTRPAVQATGLVKSFAGVPAVDGIDVEIRRGEVFGVLGPNGAGKTTMLKMLATLLSIDGGRAEIFGVDVRTRPHVIRQLVGVTGQYASVDENLTARENLWLFARLHGIPSARARGLGDDLLARFDLQDAADRRISQFSGGMRRRLDLAASLITAPPLIFLDEPTTGLDPRTRGQMWQTIRDLVADGCTVLLTTQYLDEADQLADRIAVIDHGRKVAEGTPDDLKERVGTSTLNVRMVAAADAARAADVVRGQLALEVTLAPERRAFSVPLLEAQHAADVLIALREHRLPIASAAVQKPTLDEVFLALTGHPTTDDAPGSRPDPVSATPSRRASR